MSSPSNVTGSADLPSASSGQRLTRRFRHAWRTLLLPALDDFAPELLIISAEFDAHRADPLAQLLLGAEDYAWITRELAALARRHSGGRVISLLEGGYDLLALAQSAAAHVRALEAAPISWHHGRRGAR